MTGTRVDDQLVPGRRLALAFGVILYLFLGGLGVRLAWIALQDHDAALERMERQTLRVAEWPARRGAILDRHGRELAGDLDGVRAWVLPRNVIPPDATPAAKAAKAEAIARWLEPHVGTSHDELVLRLLGDRWTALGAPVTDPSVIAAMELARARGVLRGIDLLPAAHRRNPWRSVAGNVVGYTNYEGRGVSGLEQGLDEILSGTPGQRTYRVDRRGLEIADPALPQQMPVDGRDVVLTLDARMQQVVEEELLAAHAEFGTERAFAVAMDPRSGDVLVLASVPGLDVDDDSSRPQHESVLAPLQEVYPPGSTFKPLMMAMALEMKIAHPAETPIDTRGGRFGRRTIRDSHPQPHPLSLEEIIVHSSNIGMARIFTRLVPEGREKETALMAPVHDALRALGFGSRTGLPFPAEVAGQVTPLSRWTRNYTLASVAFGQEIGVSALQMATATSSLADGLLRPARLVLPLQGQDEHATEQSVPRPRRVFEQRHVDAVRHWMALAVENGPCELVKLPGLAVAGKTGSATSETDKSFDVHSYAALVPAEAPVLTLVVVLRHPKGVRYASESAAPTAGRILRRLLPYMGHALEE